MNALHPSAVVAGKLLGRKNVTVREADAAVSFTKLLFFMVMMMMNVMVTDAASRCNPFTKYFPSSELDLRLEILAAPQNKVETLRWINNLPE